MDAYQKVHIQERIQRDDADKLDVIIVGGGLGGLGAAISILLAGHNVTVLEAAAQIGEVGAGIQILPNSARVLQSWGVWESLEPFATKPSVCNFIGWKGNHLSSMDYVQYGKACGGEFWDFYRVNLHKCLLDRAVELGCQIITDARVINLSIQEPSSLTDSSSTATVYTVDKRAFTADLVVAADGINSTLRDLFVGHPDPPTPTGDLAYRLLLDVDRMRQDPDLCAFLDQPQVNYWLGPDKHAVNYVLQRSGRGGPDTKPPTLLFNMVLLVPDDLPADGANTLQANIAEMRAHFADWDPRLPKLLALCDSVLKWRLLSRPNHHHHNKNNIPWSHLSSAAFTMLGDAVHATLPYLASGAGMALEDAGVLGLCLARVGKKESGDGGGGGVKKALLVYEACRRARTEQVVERGSYNQWIYHLHDGEEQRAREERLCKFEALDRKWLAGEKPVVLPRVEETGEDPFPWRYHGVGRWLLTYNMWDDVEAHWPSGDKLE